MRRARYLGWAAIGASVLAIYAPLLGAPPLTWDDTEHIFENGAVRTADLAEIWAAPSFGFYVPITRTLWALTYQMGDGATVPFRALNLVLHLLNVLMVGLVLRTMWQAMSGTEGQSTRPTASDAMPLSAQLGLLAGTALFAVHPAQVAAVAWISGTRDLAATAFALVAWWIVLRPRLTAATVTAALLAFAGALLCKPQVAGVPLAIAAWWWCTDRPRLRARGALLAAWAAMVLGAIVITQGAQDAPASSIPTRGLVALDALGFYARLVAWPWPLAADYGRTPAWLLAHPIAIGASIATLLLLAFATWRVVQRDAPPRAGALAALFVFALLLAPVLGLLPFAYQRISTVADHYLYLPLLGASLWVALAVRHAAARLEHEQVRTAASRAGSAGWRLRGVVALLGGGLLLLTTVSAQRTAVWRAGDEPFYRAMLAANAESFSARINLSVLLCERGDWTEGLTMLDGAASLASTDAPYLANRAFCLLSAGRFREAIALAPTLEQPVVRRNFDGNRRAAIVFVNSLAAALHEQGDEPMAFAWLCWARTLAPDDGDVAANLAVATRLLQGEGPPVVCPSGLSWEQLGQSTRPTR